MRVLYFSNDFGPHDERFLAALAKTRHEVHFLRLRNCEGGEQDAALPAGIHQVNWAGLRGPFRWRHVPQLALGVRRVIEALKPDLIHAGPIQTCAFVAALSGFRPLLTMSWGFDLMQDAERSPIWRWATAYTLRKSSFFVSDASVTQERAVAYGMRRQRTAVFPWGVDLRRFRPRVPRLAGGPPSNTFSGLKRRSARPGDERALVLLCNRSWEERYGVDVLARAFVSVARQLPGVSLILIGSGSQGEKIRAILEDGGQLQRVMLAGRIPPDSIHLWYQKADLFISPSHVDGSSVSLMEALASGTPSLVSNIPANCEWVTDNVNGWLFRDGDSKHLAERILWIAGHRGVLSRISRAARKTAEERADWRLNFKILLRAYDQAVALRG